MRLYTYRNFLLKITFVFNIIFLFSCCNHITNKKIEHPNLIYIFPDQFRKTAMGFWESPAYKGILKTKGDPVFTPSIDKFANQSMIFTSAVSNCPVCSPHRGSLMTGIFPSQSGVPINCNSSRPYSSLKQDVTCFSDVLASQNYNLSYFGKWHLDHPTPNNPQKPGTYLDDRWPSWDAYTPPERRHGFNYWYSYGTFDVHNNPHYFDNQGERYDPHEYSPKHEADMIIKYLRNTNSVRDSEKPFALFWGINPPHSPYNTVEDCQRKDYLLYKDELLSDLLVRDNVDTTLKKAKSAPFYFANVTGVDREFGRVLNELEQLGIDQNTIVVFTSDHGEIMCSQGTNNAKNQIYNEAFEVPFLIRWPKRIKHSINSILLSTPDIMPSLLAMMGFSKEIPSSVKGTDYSSIFLNSEEQVEAPKSALYIRNVDGERDSLGVPENYFPSARGVKTERYSLEISINRSYKLSSTKFFDNISDPYQMVNMPVDFQDPLIQGLLLEMAYWLEKSDDPWDEKKVLDQWINP